MQAALATVRLERTIKHRQIPRPQTTRDHCARLLVHHVLPVPEVRPLLAQLDAQLVTLAHRTLVLAAALGQGGGGRRQGGAYLYPAMPRG